MEVSERNYPEFTTEESGIKITLFQTDQQKRAVDAVFLGKFKISEEEAEALASQIHSAMVLVCRCAGYDYVQKVFKDIYTFDDDLNYVDGYVEGYFRLKVFDYVRRHAGVYFAHMTLGRNLSNTLTLDLSSLAKPL